MCTWKETILLLESSINVNWVNQLLVLFRSFLFSVIFCLLVLLITKRKVLKSPSIFQNLSVSPFISIIYFSMYFDSPLLSAYAIRIIISFDELMTFTTVHYSFLLLVILFVLKLFCMILILSLTFLNKQLYCTTVHLLQNLFKVYSLILFTIFTGCENITLISFVTVLYPQKKFCIH